MFDRWELQRAIGLVPEAAFDPARPSRHRRGQRASVDGSPLAQPPPGQLWAGVDEAGRGPLAGPLVACALVAHRLPDGVRDSKALTAARRRALWQPILESCQDLRVAVAPPAYIDAVNVQRAALAAMARAVEALEAPFQQLWVDGHLRLPLRRPVAQQPVVGGDATIACVAAASVVAKVVRDAIMEALERLYPGYGFARHKGYPTREHLRRLEQLGPSPIHRRTFRWHGHAGETPATKRGA